MRDNRPRNAAYPMHKFRTAPLTVQKELEND